MTRTPQVRHRSSTPLWIGLLVAVAAVLVGVVFWSRQPRQQTVAPSAPLAVTRPELRPAPDMEISLYQGANMVGGEKVRLSQLWATGKPVVLNYFAGLCPPCRAEMPDFQRLYDAGGKDRFMLISVDIGPFIGLGSRDEGKALLRELGITFPAGTVFDEDVIGAYQILGMPTTAFITANGKILRKHTGLLTLDQMRAFSEELVKVSGGR